MKFFKPVTIEQTESVAAGATETLTVDIGNYGLLLKSLTLTAGANNTIDSIAVDGTDIKDIGPTVDIEALFGAPVLVRSAIVVTITSADAGAQDTSIVVRGVREA